ncbi:ac52 [Hemileuca sp. nucleopolyhedrovirus]|uniref:Ac52 n=1 Tax=Hemileuca sp. nucleopolyhedrovirus TaxID=1367203 RepID=S5N972_9ABAC|nr:ac52 [Hemileuca sp. nucleopolyhedrovirus]AGR56792.1 ac52 [Hemileuca sp. nucleopolyhedrovirus]
MELIKHFVKYSKKYRTCNDGCEKTTIYCDWSGETESLFKLSPSSSSTDSIVDFNNNNVIVSTDKEKNNVVHVQNVSVNDVRNGVDETKKNGVDKTKNNGVDNHVGNNVVCDFCYETVENELPVCRSCFFPLCEQLMDKELALYTLLSVCFYEENGECLNVSQTVPVINDEKYNVWTQRLKLTWQMYENEDKLYKIMYTHCVQCELPTIFLGYTTKNFNPNLFCRRCMFPLFVIL